MRRDNGEMELQLFKDLIEWPEIAKLQPNDYFFSRNVTNKGKLSNLKLTTRAVVSRMKATAEKQGVNPTLISAKSLRRALGTDLTRSNISKEAINACGRWSKNSNTCTTNYALVRAGNITGTMSAGIKRSTNLELQRMNRGRNKLTKHTE